MFAKKSWQTQTHFYGDLFHNWSVFQKNVHTLKQQMSIQQSIASLTIYLFATTPTLKLRRFSHSTLLRNLTP